MTHAVFACCSTLASGQQLLWSLDSMTCCDYLSTTTVRSLNQTHWLQIVQQLSQQRSQTWLGILEQCMLNVCMHACTHARCRLLSAIPVVGCDSSAHLADKVSHPGCLTQGTILFVSMVILGIMRQSSETCCPTLRSITSGFPMERISILPPSSL